MPSYPPRQRRTAALFLAACAAGGLIVTTAPLAGAAAPVNETERAAATVAPAIVYIEGYWTGYVYDETGTPFNDGQPYELGGRCTGFGVNSQGYIATAGHCIASPDAPMQLIEAAAEDAVENNPGLDIETAISYGAQYWTIDGLDEDGKPTDLQMYVQRGTATSGQVNNAVPARVVDYKPFEEGDVALLKVDATNQSAVELTPDSEVQIGTDVLSIGYPASTDEVTDVSMEPTNKDGQISAKKTTNGVPVYETSAALSQGMSGGPTVGEDGRVIGVNSFMPSEENQPFNYIAPASGLSELMAANGLKAQLSQNDRTYRQGLNDYFAGHYTSAIAAFDKVLTLDPQHKQAAEFKTRAAQDREKFGDTQEASSFPVLPVAIGGGAALLLAAGLLSFFLIRRNRRGSGGGGQPVLPTGGPLPNGNAGAWQPAPGPYQPAGHHPGPGGYPSSPPVGIPQQQRVPTPPQGFAPANGVLPMLSGDEPIVLPPTPAPTYPPSMESLMNRQAGEAELVQAGAGAPAAGMPAPTATPNGGPTADPTSAAFTRFCPSCGSRHGIDARFCPNCGTDVR